MKPTLIFIIVIAVASGSAAMIAFADEATVGKTRAQVKAETAQARAAGLIPQGDLDKLPRDIDPKRYPQEPATPPLSREAVIAELRDAQAKGEVYIGDSGRTLAEEQPSRYAGGFKPVTFKHRTAKTTEAAASSVLPAR